MPFSWAKLGKVKMTMSNSGGALPSGDITHWVQQWQSASQTRDWDKQGLDTALQASNPTLKLHDPAI